MQLKIQSAKRLFFGCALLMLVNSIWAEQEANVEPLPLDELQIFSAVFGTIKQDYVEAVPDKKLIEGALKGMVASLDPHSAYLDEKAYQEIMTETQGEFGGLGIEVIPENGLIKVVAPIEDTPADKAGMKNGDLIVKIDDTQVQTLSSTEAVSRMRGKPNTSVMLTVIRKGASSPLVFKLRRAVIKVRGVKSRLLEPNYGYIRIAQFQEHTTESVVTAINQLYRENQNRPLEGIILDLRNDPGGLIQGAVGVPAIFLPQGSLVVYTKGRADNGRVNLYALPKFYLTPEQLATKKDFIQQVPAWTKNVPVVVLVNSGSASASEIVAGALQDHKRALILGTQTFGKGSVQIILPIDGGKAGLRLTISRYFTPNGRSIQAKGITPDIVVEEALLNKELMNNQFQLREADLENHLENKDQSGQEIKKFKEQSPTLSPEEKRIRELSAKDYQLQQALSTLKVQHLLIKKNERETNAGETEKKGVTQEQE